MTKLRKEYSSVIWVSLGLTLSNFVVASHQRLSNADLHSELKMPTPTEVAVSPVWFEPRFSMIQCDNSFIGFKEKMGYRESRCNYFLVNNYGYMGKYQFGKTALSFYGVEDSNTFLNTPELQEKLFHTSLASNKWLLRKEIAQYNGKKVRNVIITESGILAAAHLAGVTNVKRFFKTSGSYNFADANGTTIINYLKSFQGYDLSNITPKNMAKI